MTTATAKRPKKTADCKCVQQLNEQLAERNVVIVQELMFDFKNGKADMSPPLILVRKRDSDKRTKLPTLLASYCPFCGKKYARTK